MKKIALSLLVMAASIAAEAQIKIAVFDHDFSGYKEAIGKTLPAQTVFHPGELQSTKKKTFPAHGLKMAEIVAEDLMPRLNFTLHLYEVGGYSNFKAAIDSAIAENVDIILHPLVREYGSNFDGKGFFNAEVNRATGAGIIWINAAGNFGKTTYTGMPSKVRTGSGEDRDIQWVRLPGEQDSLQIECAPPKGVYTCDTRIVLSWTDHKNDPNIGTTKDLDMYLADDTMKNMNRFIESSELKQTDVFDKDDDKLTKYPREIIETELSPGKYTLRIKNASKNFSKDDRFRVASDSPYIIFENFDANESILNPADNPDVITVGANDSDRSSRSVSLQKPEVSLPSKMNINGRDAYGSSIAAARATARAAVLLVDTEGEATKNDLIVKLELPLDPVDGPGVEVAEQNVAGIQGSGEAVSSTEETFDDRRLRFQRSAKSAQDFPNGAPQVPVATAGGKKSTNPFVTGQPVVEQAQQQVSQELQPQVSQNQYPQQTGQPMVRNPSYAQQGAPQAGAPQVPQFDPNLIPPGAGGPDPMVAGVPMGPNTGPGAPQPQLRPPNIPPWQGFTSTQPNCFERAALPPQPYYIDAILQRGGQIVRTTDGFKVAMSVDPIALNPYLRRVRPDDIIVATPGGLILRPRAEAPRIPPHWAEVFQLPPGIGYCN